MQRTSHYFWLAVVATLMLGRSAAAQTVVLPPGNASVEGTAGVNRPLDLSARTAQFVYGSALLSGLPIGSQLKRLQFRTNNTAGASPELSYANFDIVVSQSLHAPGSLSSTYADNIAADAVTVRSGALHIPAGAFPATGVPRPFGPVIEFSTPYTYTGGHLLLTFRHTDSLLGTSHSIDSAGDNPNVQSKFGSGYDDAEADFNGNDAPVIQLNFEPASDVVPEPPGGVLLLAGLLAPALLRHRRWNSS